MPHDPYLIVGGGMTADAAVHGIPGSGPEWSHRAHQRELDRPYNRPPLTKGLWKGDKVDSIWRGTEGQHTPFRCTWGAWPVPGIWQARASPTTSDGLYVRPAAPGHGWERRAAASAGGGIIYYRTVEDYRQLRTIV